MFKKVQSNREGEEERGCVEPWKATASTPKGLLPLLWKKLFITNREESGI